MKKLLIASLLAAFAVTLPLRAADPAPGGDTPKKPAVAGEAKKAGKVQVAPFRGKLTAVDKLAKTITVGERVFQITSKTKLVKAGKPCVLEGAVVGEDLGGQYKTADDGKLEALSVRFGAKPDAKPAALKKDTKPAAK